MASQAEKNFAEFFLSEFTKEILKSTTSYRGSLIKTEIRNVVYRPKVNQQKFFTIETNPIVKRSITETIRKKADNELTRISELRQRQTTEDVFAEFAPKSKIPRGIAPILIIPETNLPITVRDIRPIPDQAEIDLRKLNPFVRDPLVRIIECNGPGEKVVVMGQMGRKNTPIELTKEEIDSVISKFSEETKIPVGEGVYKVVLGRLVISALVSEVIGSKFIIKKL